MVFVISLNENNLGLKCKQKNELAHHQKGVINGDYCLYLHLINIASGFFYFDEQQWIFLKSEMTRDHEIFFSEHRFNTSGINVDPHILGINMQIPLISGISKREVSSFYLDQDIKSKIGICRINLFQHIMAVRK